jgi:hypothetical protein
MRTGRLRSIQVGFPRSEDCDDATDPTIAPWKTAIFKLPVSGSLWLGRTNLQGDGQADLVHHGGIDKAVCVYSADHWAYWQMILPPHQLRGGHSARILLWSSWLRWMSASAMSLKSARHSYKYHSRGSPVGSWHAVGILRIWRFMWNEAASQAGTFGCCRRDGSRRIKRYNSGNALVRNGRSQPPIESCTMLGMTDPLLNVWASASSFPQVGNRPCENGY